MKESKYTALADWVALARVLAPIVKALIDFARELFGASYYHSQSIGDEVAAQVQRSLKRGEIVDEHGVKFTWDVALEPQLRAFVAQLAKDG